MERLFILARSDFMDSARERQLFVLAVLFGLCGLGIGYLTGSQFAVTGPALATQLLGLFAFLAPLTAILLSYNVIVGKRTSGELTVLLGLPFSRAEVVLGTAIGRFGILGALTVVGAVVGAIATALFGGSVAPIQLAGAVGATLALSLAFVALSVGISASTRNTTRASGLAFGAFLLFVFRLWDGIPVLLNIVFERYASWTIPSAAIDLYLQLAPHAAVRNLVQAVDPSLASAFAASVSVAPGGPVLGVLVLGGWIAGPLLVGYARFANADL